MNFTNLIHCCEVCIFVVLALVAKQSVPTNKVDRVDEERKLDVHARDVSDNVLLHCQDLVNDLDFVFVLGLQSLVKHNGLSQHLESAQDALEYKRLFIFLLLDCDSRLSLQVNNSVHKQFHLKVKLLVLGTYA